MSLCLTENNSRLSSADSELDQEVKLLDKSSAMDLSALALNFRALNLLDTSLNFISKIPTSFSNSSSEKIAGNKMNSRSGLDDKFENSLPIISLDEVAWHDTLDDCWMVICDYVYDCTKFIKNHPGGQDILIEYAGRDATLAFIGTGHSKAANRILERYLIGELPVAERIFRTPNGLKVYTLNNNVEKNNYQHELYW